MCTADHHAPTRDAQSLRTVARSVPIWRVTSFWRAMGKSSNVARRFPSRMPFDSGLETYSFRTMLFHTSATLLCPQIGQSHPPERLGVQCRHMLHSADQLPLKEVKALRGCLVHVGKRAQGAVHRA